MRFFAFCELWFAAQFCALEIEMYLADTRAFCRIEIEMGSAAFYVASSPPSSSLLLLL